MCRLSCLKPTYAWPQQVCGITPIGKLTAIVGLVAYDKKNRGLNMKKTRGKKTFRQWTAMAMIAVQSGFYTPYAYAASQPVIPGYYGKDTGTLVPPSVNALPVVRSVVRNATLSQATDNELVVHQTADKAVIDWESFDIGASAHTRFDQQGQAAWSVLNRIHDQNPSQIFGRLTADGTVYLINPNGFLFSSGAVVNVHSLTASALNLKNDFLSDLFPNDLDKATYFADMTLDEQSQVNSPLVFSTEALTGMTGTATDAHIVNHGLIQTDNAGAVILLAPHVVNTGTIDAPMGRVVLGAGDYVRMYEKVNAETLMNVVDVQTSGDRVVLNDSTGSITSDLGEVGLYGSCVNQAGLVRSVTAAKKNGRIVLSGTDSVITGADSRTVCLISDSPEKVHSSFAVTPGEITVTAGSTIDHKGLILNPAGTVTLSAGDRIYLSSKSRIDVSGVTAELAAAESVVTVKLNSVELKDDQLQKDGILKGEEVSFPVYAGSSIGDVSSSLSDREVTAAEKAVQGGEITLTSINGEVIARDGSVLDFKGGSTHYAEGYADTTWLVSGNRVYSISDAPGNLRYDSILGEYEKSYGRFGITETLGGVYFGGSSAVKTRITDFYTGADAGTLNIFSRSAVLDGILDGSVMPGLYQLEDGLPDNEFGRIYALGLDQPLGGALTMGYTMQADRNENAISAVNITGEIAVVAEKNELPESFTADTALMDVAADLGILSEFSSDTYTMYKTLISADTLSGSGLSTVTLGADTRVAVERGAHVSLAAGGSFNAGARNITVEGEILVPAGTVSLISGDTRTTPEIFIGSSTTNPSYVSGDLLPERIYLGEHSVISTAGETVDNSLALAEGTAIRACQEKGGTIKLLDKNYEGGEGVILKEGSLLDVSGGYEITAHGGVAGGGAGTILLQGLNLVLDGTLSAYSLEGCEGGRLDLFAKTVTVTADEPGRVLGSDFSASDPLGLDLGLVLSGNRLDNTGVTRLNLSSCYDLTVKTGADLGLSAVKLTSPLGGTERSAEQVTVFRDETGETKVSLEAGKTMEFAEEVSPEVMSKSRIVMESGSRITADPGGSITAKGPGIDIDGTLDAPAGTIGLTAGDLGMTLGQNAKILALGYNKPEAGEIDENGALLLTPLDGGTVTLKSAANLTTEGASLIDVSGAQAVTRTIIDETGRPVSKTLAGNAGTVNLTFRDNTDVEGKTTVNGSLKAGHADVDGVTGGTLSVTKTETINGLDISSGLLKTYSSDGFDALTLASGRALNFKDSLNADIGRTLTLDAPEIRASGDSGQQVLLRARDVTLENSWGMINHATESRQALLDSSSLALKGTFMDIGGALDVSGFGTVNLEAERSISCGDRFYQYFSSGVTVNAYSGLLDIQGDLNLTASRIFPTTLSDFTLRSGGMLTTLSSGVDEISPVYSAGGRLVLEAETIDHGGVLEAPMGSIVLCGKDRSGADTEDYQRADRVTLRENSRISTAGDAAVLYGNYTSDASVWLVTDKTANNSSTQMKFESLGDRSVVMAGETVVSEKNSSVDVSGGGSVYTYLFQNGVEGTTDPLKADKTCVLLPLAADAATGEGIWLSGGSGVAEGRYVVMSEEYAFQPGALIVTDMGAARNLASGTVSEAGYPVIIGYASAAGQDGHSPTAHAYVVRNAEAVLKEGNYSYKEKTAPDAGSFTVNAGTHVLDATLSGAGKDGGHGGTIDLSGAHVVIGETTDAAGKLVIDPSSLSGSGFENITLGGLDTEDLTVTAASRISVENLTLRGSLISLEGGSSIDTGLDGTGTVSLLSANGIVDLHPGSVIRAGEFLTLEGQGLNLGGTLAVEQGTLSLSAGSVSLVSGNTDFAAGSSGLILDQDLWDMVSDVRTLYLTSRKGISVDGGLSLEMQGGLVLDAATLSLDTDSGKGKTATLTAGTLSLENNGAKDVSPETPSADPEGNFSLSARENLTVAFADRAESDKETGVSRSISLTGAGKTMLNAGGELRLKGQGVLDAAGDLTLSAPVVTGLVSATEKTDGTTRYTTADTTVRAANGTLNLEGGGGVPVQECLGGSYRFEGLAVTHRGAIVTPSGTVSFIATGNADQGVTLKPGSVIDVSGTGDAPAGSVLISAAHGGVTSDSGSTVDVSAGGQGTAGSLTVSARENTVALIGALEGKGSDSRVDLDVNSIDDPALATVLNALNRGGLDDTVTLRVRNGDVTVTGGLSASDIHIGADRGDLTVASGVSLGRAADEGGTVVLDAGKDLVLENDSRITATGTAGNGGNVSLTAVSGVLALEQGALIDVSGAEAASGGSVTVNAVRKDGDSVAVNLDGTVKGASSVTVTAFDVKEGVTAVNAGVLADVKQETEDFMAAVAASGTVAKLLQNLTLTDRTGTEMEGSGLFRVAPGIELRSSGNMIFSTDWDMNGFATEPGTLVLRSEGDLTLSNGAALLSHPTLLNDLKTGTQRDSWNVILTAGADFGASDRSATADSGTAGKLTLSNGSLVYSESGDIRLSSRLAMALGWGREQFYSVENDGNYCSVASYDGSITLETGDTLTLTGGAVQNGTGDIDVSAAGDIEFKTRKTGNLSITGSVRTTGEAPDSLEGYQVGASVSNQSRFDLGFLYKNGGDITVQSGGDISGCPVEREWSVSTVLKNAEDVDEVHWAAGYGETTSKIYTNSPVWTQGIAAMGGGDVRIDTQGSLSCFGGVFGEGKLAAVAGGDLNGRFLVNKGTGRLYTAGSFGTDTVMENQTLELCDAAMTLFAQGSIALGSVVSPSMLNIHSDNLLYNRTNRTWNPGYSENASATIISGIGDISIKGRSGFFQSEINLRIEPEYGSWASILPPSLTLISGNDIHLIDNLSLFSSENGQLNLTAAGDIDKEDVDGSINLKATLDMWAYDLTLARTPILSLFDLLIDADSRLINYISVLPDHLNHVNDEKAVRIQAGGDIRNLNLVLPKKAEIIAGGDILDLGLTGQNLHADDLTLIKAGGDITFSTTVNKDENFAKIEMGGPGHVAVMAGGDIDLGNSEGITSVGSLWNPALSAEGCDILVVSGFAGAFDLDAVTRSGVFLDMVKALGTAYSTALGADGHTVGADMILAEVKKAVDGADEAFLSAFMDILGEEKDGGYVADDLIAAARAYLKQTLPGYTGPGETSDSKATENSAAGNIDMVRSQIATRSGGDISIIAKGDISVGQSVFSSSADKESTGINAMFTGDIDVFAIGDVNVNEARLMTWLGGDIGVWSDQGNINAGRGSRTEVSTGRSQVITNEDGTKVVRRTPVAVGSGIRALTFDPDGLEGKAEKPEPGNVFLFAPAGVIDAGEAGIAGSRLFLAAEKVLNVQNISFSQGAVGTPMVAESTVNLGAISGAGSLAASQVGDTASALSAVNKAFEESAKKMEETFLPSWLRVEFMGFDVNDGGM